MRSDWRSAWLLVLVAASAVCGDESPSGRLSSRDFDQAYPGKKVFAASATASSTYGRGWDAEQAAGAPKVFPRLGDNRGAWACKDKRSPKEWLEVEFPATEAELTKAAQQAEAHEFILDLEDPEGRKGYDAHVGERGVKLSGGQRQRIALARVILKNAPILVLDEATSALDSEVEAEIQKTLYGMMAGKTVIAIAHRLSTIAQMDRTLVLDDGHIVEQGTHGELLAQGGLYSRFWSRQSGGFIDTETEAAE